MENLTTVVGQFWTSIGSTVTTIAGNPLLLIPIAGTFVGMTISFTKSLMGTRRRRRG